MKKGILLFVLFFSASVVLSQSELANEIIEQRIELLLQDEGNENIDLTTLFDDLLNYLENPINLNYSALNDLQEFNLLTEIQVFELVRYREQYGLIYSSFELASIKYFTAETVKSIRPFISLNTEYSKPQKIKNVFKYGRHEVILREFRRIETTDAYNKDKPETDRFLGSSDRIYARYRFKYRKNVSAGITFEKDPGEQFISQRTNQPDFFSFHLQLKQDKFIRNFIVGDYQFQAGQGLTFWSGFGVRKSPFMATSIKRYGRGALAYTSSEENRFLRGSAITIGKDILNFTSFASYKKIDANRVFSTDSLETELGFSSIQTSGFHRTFNELLDQDAINELNYGGRLALALKKLKLGLTANKTSFDGDFIPNLQLYQNFQNSNNTWFNLGADYDLLLGPINIYGEIARSQNGAIAYINGLTAYLNSRFTLTIVNRNYPENFQALYANSFGEKGSNYNEVGTYIGTEFNPAKGVKLSGFYDLYNFKWVGYQHDAPSLGYEIGIGSEITINRSILFKLMYRSESKELNSSTTETTNRLSAQLVNQYRIQLDYKINDKLSGKNRLEYKEFSKDNTQETGILIYQDIGYTISDKLKLIGRVAFFDTDGYNSRIYAYENDMRYQFTVPSYYDTGSKYYLIATYKPIKQIQIAVRWNQVYWNTERSIGSSPDSYLGFSKNEIKVQAIVKF
jgi:hypothetical protein|tara:strand:+ start:9980 stop:12028 length:2049 start_codon:yes stop_codon:yes gene_type:complete